MSKQQCDAKARSEGLCRLCRRPWTVRKPTRHRIVEGCQGGAYRTANVVPLCRPCHDLVHHPDPAVRLPARRMLRASMWPVEVAHAVARLGAAAFDRCYPPPARDAVLERRRIHHRDCDVGACVPRCPLATA